MDQRLESLWPMDDNRDMRIGKGEGEKSHWYYRYDAAAASSFWKVPMMPAASSLSVSFSAEPKEH